MDFKEFQDIIDFAISKENEAVTFYKEAAEVQTMEGPRKMFEEFAEEELKHVELLQNIEMEEWHHA